MNRRHFAVGLALGSSFIASAANAQGGQPTLNLPNSDMEAKYQLETLQTGTLALETSRLAQKMTKDARIKEFANFEIAEQETIAEILKDKMTDEDQGKQKYPAQRADARSGNAAAPQVSPTVQTGDIINKLRNAQGAEFDREYVKAQIDGHQKLLAIQERYIAEGKNKSTVAVAKLARGMIKEHLTLLGHMQNA